MIHTLLLALGASLPLSAGSEALPAGATQPGPGTATERVLVLGFDGADYRTTARMIEEGQPCLDIASQMAAVRKALDSTYVRMTVCFMQQELHTRLGADEAADQSIDAVLDGVQDLLGKIR